MALFEEQFEGVTEYLERLAPRERTVLLAGVGAGVALLGFLLYLWIGGSLDNRLADNTDRTRKLEKILQLEGEFDRARKKVAQIERRVASNRVNLISFLDQVSRSTGVSISQMDPAPEATSRRGSRVKEETVRVNIAKVKVGPLARFMDRIENSGRLVKIRRLIVKPTFANRTVLEVSLHVSTYRLKKK